MTKVLKSTYRKLWRLSACKKSSSSLTSFWRHCKDIAQLLFWELWECLTIHIKIIVLIRSKLPRLSAYKKSTSSLTSFLRYCKEIALVVWGNLGLSAHTHLNMKFKYYISIWRNLRSLSAAKYQLHPSRFPSATAKVL